MTVVSSSVGPDPDRDRPHSSSSDPLRHPTNGDLVQELSSCEKAIEAAPERADLFALKCQLLLRLGRWAEADACIQTALRLPAVPPRVMRSLAKLLERQGQFWAAARALGRAIDLSKDREDWREWLVTLLLESRCYAEAAQQIAISMQRVPRPELAALLTRALDGLTRDAEANISPSARAAYEEASASLREGRPAEAEAALTAIVRQRPEWVEPWIALRGARFARGGLAEADATVAEWREAAPSHTAIIEMIATRRPSARGLLFDPREPLRLQPKAQVLEQVHDRDALVSGENAQLVIDRGGQSIRYSPILSVEDNEADWFAVETETSESFIATFRNAAVVGRGLVVTEQNELVIEATIPNPGKYAAESRDGQWWCDLATYADGAMPARFCDRAAFLVSGPTDRSFGDWIWRFPPRLTLARAAGLDLPLVVSDSLPPRFLEMLELIGFDRSRLIFLEPGSVTVFRQLFVPSWPTVDRLRPMRDWNLVYRPLARKGMRIWQRAVSRGEVPAERQLLYLARTKVTARPLTNEHDVIDLFAARGFRVIHPQEMSWAETLETFACPAVVAGPYGAALRNLVFCQEKPLGLVLMRPCDEEFLRGTAVWLAEMGVRFAYVRGEVATGVDCETLRTAPWTVDIGKVERALDRVLEIAGRSAGDR